jgi:(p)ppGpp synthase/HD superfamily hydrolase
LKALSIATFRQLHLYDLFIDEFNMKFTHLPQGFTPQTKETEQAVSKAYQLINKLYGNSQRKFSDELSVKHPIEVFRLVANISLKTHVLVAALLHDVLEDFDYSEGELLQEFGEEVLSLVKCLTKRKVQEGESRMHRNMEYWNIVRQHSEQAVLIKLCDTYSNLNSTGDPTAFRLRYLTEKAISILFFEGKCPAYDVESAVKTKIKEGLRSLVNGYGK